MYEIVGNDAVGKTDVLGLARDARLPGWYCTMTISETINCELDENSTECGPCSGEQKITGFGWNFHSDQFLSSFVADEEAKTDLEAKAKRACGSGPCKLKRGPKVKVPTCKLAVFA
jgi:hypothetical protein